MHMLCMYTMGTHRQLLLFAPSAAALELTVCIIDSLLIITCQATCHGNIVIGMSVNLKTTKTTIIRTTKHRFHPIIIIIKQMRHAN